MMLLADITGKLTALLLADGGKKMDKKSKIAYGSYRDWRGNIIQVLHLVKKRRQ